MMKKILNFTKLISLSVLFTVGLTGCGMTINCPEFDEAILSWIPYQENDVIELYSQSKDSTIMFSIRNVKITHTTDYKTGVDCGGACYDEIRIRQNEDDNFKFQVEISLTKNKITNQSYQIGDTRFGDGNYIYSELTNYQFENEEYEVVKIFEKTESKGTFRKLIFAKGIGIIGLIDVHGNTWILKTDVKINRLDVNERERGIVIDNVSGCQ